MQTAFAHQASSLYEHEATAHTHAVSSLLARAITTTNDWIERQQDPELRDFGRRFNHCRIGTGCHEQIDIHYFEPPRYESFSYNPAEWGFINCIRYGPAAADDLAVLYSNRVHELTHAMQKRRSPALHASPFNPGSDIVICPRDWVLLEVRCEQDANVKQALMNSLLARSFPAIRDKTRKNVMTVSEWEAIRGAAPNIDAAIITAAGQVLDKSIYWDDPQSPTHFLHTYQEQALRNYTSGMAMRRRNGETGLTFVRAEWEDIWAIGASCGLNSFGVEQIQPEFLQHPALLADSAKALSVLESKLGIQTNCLPTLSQELARRRLTRAEFVSHTYEEAEVPDTPPTMSRSFRAVEPA